MILLIYGMRKYIRILLIVLLLLEVLYLLSHMVSYESLVLLNPKGFIAKEQRNLMLTAIGIMLLIVIPVIASLFYVVWKYRENGDTPKQSPESKDTRVLEAVCWIAPAIIICILAFLNWHGTKALDPYKPLDARKKQMSIQVVALQWRWLFIYPEYGIATINYLQFPKDTPVRFDLTADGPMSSFWIPALSGQIYAMTGMETRIHLIGNEYGEYAGSSAEISGKGFSGMRFVAKVSSYTDFDTWVDSVRLSPRKLDYAEYQRIAIPSENSQQYFYSSIDTTLYDMIIDKYMIETVKGGMDHHQ